MAKCRLRHGIKGTGKMLYEWALRNGWTVVQTHGDNLKYVHPSIGRAIFFSLTPGCPRGWMNTRSQMRRLMVEYKIKEV